MYAIFVPHRLVGDNITISLILYTLFRNGTNFLDWQNHWELKLNSLFICQYRILDAVDHHINPCSYRHLTIIHSTRMMKNHCK